MEDERNFEAEELNEEEAEEGDVDAHRLKHDGTDPPDDGRDYMKVK